MSEQIELVEIEKIKPDPNQPRMIFDEEELEKLAETYQTQGMIHTIEIDENNTIILGHRRWRAAQKVGLKEIKVIRKIGLTKASRLERQLIDDANRKDLSEMERAWAYATAIININLTAQGKNESYSIPEVKQMEKEHLLMLVDAKTGGNNGTKKQGSSALSRKIGVPQQTISYYVTLLKTSAQIQKAIEEKKVPAAYAYEVSKLDDKKTRSQLEKTIIKELEKPREKRTIQKTTDVREIVGFINNPEIEIQKEKKNIVLIDKDKEELVTGKKTVSQMKYEKEAKVLGLDFETRAKALAKDLEENKTKSEFVKPEPRRIKDQGINIFFSISDIKLSKRIQKIAIDCDLESDDICLMIVEKWFERGYKF